MADTKISALTAATAAAAANELAINEAGASKKLTVGQVQDFLLDRAADSSVQVVAATDSSAKDKVLADFVCDGTADDVQVQAAIDALPTLGGTVRLAAGTYTFAATPLLSVNQRVTVIAYGALILLAASTGAFKVAQGITTARGVTIEGARINGQGLSATVGIEFEDTNNSSLIGVEIENCVTGILLESNAAGNYVEGSLLDNCLLRGNTTGVAFRVVSGTGSFMQTVIRGLRCVVGATGIGIDIDNPALLLRAVIQGTFWIGTDETAVDIDGNMEDATLDLAVEGEGGATGNTALTIGTNAVNLDQAFIKLLLTGTIATQISNAFTKAFHYWSGGSQVVQTAGASILGYKRHGDAANRLQFELLTAGPKISGGTGGAAVDVNLYRSAANIWVSDDKIDPASLNLQTKAGAPVDGDVIGGATDGDTIWDSTDNILYVRDGGAWVKVEAAHEAAADPHTVYQKESEKAAASGYASLDAGTRLPVAQMPVLAIARGGTILDAAGVVAVNLIVWYAPFACTVTNIRGYRVGGTGATVNARRNGSSNHLASALSLTSADTWMDGGSAQNTAYAIGDKLEIMVVSVTGVATQIAIQVDLTRP